jgi:hypothetical protein
VSGPAQVLSAWHNCAEEVVTSTTYDVAGLRRTAASERDVGNLLVFVVQNNATPLQQYFLTADLDAPEYLRPYRRWLYTSMQTAPSSTRPLITCW